MEAPGKSFEMGGSASMPLRQIVVAPVAAAATHAGFEIHAGLLAEIPCRGAELSILRAVRGRRQGGVTMSERRRNRWMGRLALGTAALVLSALVNAQVQYYDVPQGSGPHDVAADPAAGGPVYFTAQRTGHLGILDPATRKVELVALGRGSAPHGVVVGPDGGAWITDGGQNAIVRVDPATRAVRVWPLPKDVEYANLNTLTFDRKGRIWFTGQSGYYGRLDPARDDMKVWKAPRGAGPYGIATTPAGEVYYASLAGNHIARVDVETGEATVIEPPTKGQGARRVWPDSRGRIWVSYWNTGQVGRYDPQARSWQEWSLPGNRPRAYSVWVDAKDGVWLTEWTANAIVRFDPVTERFASFPSDRPNASVRQMLGRAGEAWGAESGTDRLVVVRSP
jgi:virginiamycin B lyase